MISCLRVNSSHVGNFEMDNVTSACVDIASPFVIILIRFLANLRFRRQYERFLYFALLKLYLNQIFFSSHRMCI